MGREFAHNVERPVIKEALRKNNGNLAVTARYLEMPYSTINYKIRALGLLQEAAIMRAEAVLAGKKITGRPKIQESTERGISAQAKEMLGLCEEEEDNEE